MSTPDAMRHAFGEKPWKWIFVESNRFRSARERSQQPRGTETLEINDPVVAAPPDAEEEFPKTNVFAFLFIPNQQIMNKRMPSKQTIVAFSNQKIDWRFRKMIV